MNIVNKVVRCKLCGWDIFTGKVGFDDIEVNSYVLAEA